MGSGTMDQVLLETMAFNSSYIACLHCMFNGLVKFYWLKYYNNIMDECRIRGTQVVVRQMLGNGVSNHGSIVL